MYERFSDRARKVITQLATQEAQRLNHEYIGTEHVLLGILKDGSGTAAVILMNLDIDLRRIRMEIEKIVQSGPDAVPLGKLPQTPRTKKAIEYAMQEARNFNHKEVGTEHLLLGLLREQEGVAAQVLVNLGLKLDDVREQVLTFFGQKADSGASGVSPVEESRPLPPEAVKALEELDIQIESLKKQKLAAVADEDFEKAALLRDQADKLEMKKRSLAREWQSKPLGDENQ